MAEDINPVETLLNEELASDINEMLEAVEAGTEKFLGHTKDMNNPHQTTKEQVGLGNVDNTSDMDKPVSHAVASAIESLDSKLEAAKREVLQVVDDFKVNVTTPASAGGTGLAAQIEYVAQMANMQYARMTSAFTTYKEEQEKPVTAGGTGLVALTQMMNNNTRMLLDTTKTELENSISSVRTHMETAMQTHRAEIDSAINTIRGEVEAGAGTITDATYSGLAEDIEGSMKNILLPIAANNNMFIGICNVQINTRKATTGNYKFSLPVGLDYTNIIILPTASSSTNGSTQLDYTAIKEENSWVINIDYYFDATPTTLPGGVTLPVIVPSLVSLDFMVIAVAGALNNEARNA